MDYQLSIPDDVARTLAEDMGDGDVSAQLIDPDTHLQTRLLVREDAVLCGVAWFDEVFRQCADFLFLLADILNTRSID